MSIAPDDARRKRLLYRAQHRGFKEADLVIGGFAAAHLADMTAAELDEFEALLALPDHDLYAWATGEAPAPAQARGPVFEKLRAYDVSASLRQQPSGRG
ncbi:FAD assembly factor SdhE [Amphiplicatus metriothermophilus]|uniref:FAD assembly factor SdhE n=1 Tax=Amphiplicatus metriothermophilus TaxID=1519374 RepID=A0A239PR62_9PROT|nr:succinate dehydrogenase assembly factor 2 [Amphiplicatus metriothermophilus]MBB5518635.1 antitoxin CptB [Amphiplicatus metriothermophilus]SNT72207.1 antitoxin CptB [Amphiplicatus metriothermophilus]